MDTKNAILGMAIAAVLLVAMVGSASAIDITECTVITAPGTYDITADITNGTATYCIDIQSDDVIIDGQLIMMQVALEFITGNITQWAIT